VKARGGADTARKCCGRPGKTQSRGKLITTRHQALRPAPARRPPGGRQHAGWTRDACRPPRRV